MLAFRLVLSIPPVAWQAGAASESA